MPKALIGLLTQVELQLMLKIVDICKGNIWRMIWSIKCGGVGEVRHGRDKKRRGGDAEVVHSFLV